MLVIFIIILCVSLVGMFLLVVNRIAVTHEGKARVSFPEVWDDFLFRLFHAFKVLFRELPKKVITDAYHFLVITSVHTSRKVKRFVYPRIEHILEAVKGTDVPEPEKEPSEFLKSIKDSDSDTIK